MKTQQINVYEYDELSDEAKTKARDWFREASAGDPIDDFIDEDAKTVFRFCGFTIKNIAWSGFSSQGDGASFTGSWSAADVGAKGLREHAPEDKELHRIADACAEIAKANPELTASIVRISHHYAHNRTVSLEINGDDADTENALEELARDAMDWIYRKLEKEYEYQQSDEVVADTIRANEYSFTKEGKRSVTL